MLIYSYSPSHESVGGRCLTIKGKEDSQEVRTKEDLASVKLAQFLKKKKGQENEMRKSSVLRDTEKNHGEFDPGSERTLAARLKHASRTGTRSLLLARVADW